MKTIISKLIFGIVLCALTSCGSPTTEMAQLRTPDGDAHLDTAAPTQSQTPTVSGATQPATASITTAATAALAPTATGAAAETAPAPEPVLITPPPAENLPSIQTMISPNAEWTAQASFEQPGVQYHVQFKVFRMDGAQSWSLIDYWQSGLGYLYPRLHHWSQDSAFFYFSSREVADGGCELFPAEEVWQKLTVETGEVVEFPLPTGRSHAISPDDSLMAYFSLDARPVLHLLDMLSGTERTLALHMPGRETDKLEAGNVVWSPAGDAFVFTVSEGDFCGASEYRFVLARVDVPTLAVEELVSSTQVLLRPVRWVSPDHILVGDWNGYTWWINAIGGQPVQAPQAP